jgi:hypothetical protein
MTDAKLHGNWTPARQAREARRIAESALDRVGWRWSPMLSLWIDTLLVTEEASE